MINKGSSNSPLRFQITIGETSDFFESWLLNEVGEFAIEEIRRMLKNSFENARHSSFNLSQLTMDCN